MRDLLSKLDAIISETALNPKDPKGDYTAKKKALDDLERDGETDRSAIQQRRLDLDKEAESKGVKEDTIFEIGDEFGISFTEDFEIATEIIDIVEDGIVIDLDETALEYLAQNGFTFEEINLDEDKKKGVDGKACWKGYRYAGREKKADGSYKDKCEKIGEEFNSVNDIKSKIRELEAEQEENEYGSLPYDSVDAELQYLYSKLDKAMKIGEDSDVEESGLQYYTGKKKYGKDGMAALAKAGREGASEEELGRIKDKYKKEDAEMDEAKYQGREVPLGKPMAGDVKKSKVYVKNAKGNVVKVNFGDKKMKIKKSNPKRRKSFRARHNCANPGPRWKARYWSCRAW